MDRRRENAASQPRRRRQKRWRDNWNESKKREEERKREKERTPSECDSRGERSRRSRLGWKNEAREPRERERKRGPLTTGPDIWLRSSREDRVHCLAGSWGVALANESKSNDLSRWGCSTPLPTRDLCLCLCAHSSGNLETCVCTSHRGKSRSWAVFTSNRMCPIRNVCDYFDSRSYVTILCYSSQNFPAGKREEDFRKICSFKYSIVSLRDHGYKIGSIIQMLSLILYFIN